MTKTFKPAQKTATLPLGHEFHVGAAIRRERPLAGRPEFLLEIGLQPPDGTECVAFVWIEHGRLLPFSRAFGKVAVVLYS